MNRKETVMNNTHATLEKLERMSLQGTDADKRQVPAGI